MAVDSVETVEAAAAAGLREVLVDVNVGLPRCGCAPTDAGRIADLARARGLEVRGVMGYEGHCLTIWPLEEKVAITRRFAAEVLPLFESGRLRPVVDSRYDLDDIISVFRYFAGECTKPRVREVLTGRDNVHSQVVAEPVGVVAMITPFPAARPSVLKTRG